MTAQMALWVTTTLGALLLFSLGWTAHVRGRRRFEELEVAKRKLLEESLEAERQRASEESLAAKAALEREQGRVSEALDKARTDQDDLRALHQALLRELESAKHAVRRMEEESAATARRVAEERSQASSRLAADQTRLRALQETQQRLAQSVERVANLEGELESAHARHAATLGDLQDTTVRLGRSEERVAVLERGAEEHSHIDGDLRERLTLEEENKTLRVKLQAWDGKVTAGDNDRVENQQLRDRVRELESHESAARELDRVVAELKRQRLDNELLRERVMELGAKLEQHGETKDQLEEMAQQAQGANRLRVRVRELEAQLFARHNDATDQKGRGGEVVVATRGHVSLDSGPAALVTLGGRSAVLADSAGFPIAGAGEMGVQEGLAALSGLAFEFGERVGLLVPLCGIRSIRMTDDNDIVVVCGFFALEKERFALLAIGARSLTEEAMSPAVGLAVGAMQEEVTPGHDV
jgi:hypothetical protein